MVLGLSTELAVVAYLLMAAGVILIIFEMFIPGFGVAGITGIALCLLGIVLASRSWAEGLLWFSGLLVLVGICATVVVRSAKRGKLSRSPLVLQQTNDNASGYTAATDLSALVGHIGISLTPLRPAGTADFDGARVDVVTRGDFLPAGARLRVLEVQGARIIVILEDQS